MDRMAADSDVLDHPGGAAGDAHRKGELAHDRGPHSLLDLGPCAAGY